MGNCRENSEARGKQALQDTLSSSSALNISCMEGGARRTGTDRHQARKALNVLLLVFAVGGFFLGGGGGGAGVGVQEA